MKLGYIGFLNALLGMIICIMTYELWDRLEFLAIIGSLSFGFAVFISGAIIYTWEMKK